MFYYYYIINLVENQLDNFFSHTNGDISLEDKNNVSLQGQEFFDILKYLVNFRFEEFFFFLNKLYTEYSKKNSYFFYFIFLITDLFSFLGFFLISHSWISLKIYKDYVHNSFRRKTLELLAMFLLIFLLIFILFFFFIL